MIPSGFFSSRPYRPYHGDEWAASAASGLVLLAALLLALTVYVLFRCVWLVVRVVSRHPHARGLRIALGCCLGAWTVLVLAAGVGASDSLVGTLSALAVVTTAALLLVAKTMAWADDHLLQRPTTKETLIEDVLRRPWWETA